MKKTAAPHNMSPQPRRAAAIHAPQLPHDFERIRKRAEALYAARNGMIGMALNDWLQAEQELKQEQARHTITKSKEL